jgi:hypothetical protein
LYIHIHVTDTQITTGIQQEVTSWDGLKECQLILVQAIPKHAVSYISMHALQWQYIAIAMQFLKGVLLLLISLKAYRMFEKVVLKNTTVTSPKKYTNSNNTTQGFNSTQKSSSGHAHGFFSSMKAAFTVADSDTGNNNSSRKFSSANNSPSPRERAQSSQTFASENFVASGGARTQRGSTSVMNGAVRDVRATSAAGSVNVTNESVHKKKRELGSGSNFKAAKIHIEEPEVASDPATAAEHSEL